MNDMLKIIMYLALAMIVIYLFVTISTGVEPITLIKRLGQTFEAGKIGITNALESIASVDCRSDHYVVTLDSPKFYYKEKSGEKVLDFIVVLDFERFVYIVFAVRNSMVRVISARDLNRKEYKFYEKAT